MFRSILHPFPSQSLRQLSTNITFHCWECHHPVFVEEVGESVYGPLGIRVDNCSVRSLTAHKVEFKATTALFQVKKTILSSTRVSSQSPKNLSTSVVVNFLLNQGVLELERILTPFRFGHH